MLERNRERDIEGNKTELKTEWKSLTGKDLGKQLLCILTCFHVLHKPQSWSKHFFGSFQLF